VKPTRRFAFGHDPALPRVARQPVAHADEITAPLPDGDAPASPIGEGRPTLPLAPDAATKRPVLPFRVPVMPTLQREVAPPPQRDAVPVRDPRRTRMGLYAVIAALVLYNVGLLVIVAPWRAARVPVEVTPSSSPTTNAPPVISPPDLVRPPSTAPTPEVSAPAPPASASIDAPQVSVPRVAPPHVKHLPAPAHTARPAGGDVRDPWGDSR
jgi:hypothetical protein